MAMRIGTSGWSYEHWKGRFYPDSLAKSHWFDFYAQHFNTVEVNATFYRRFADRTYHKWREQAPEGFRYVLKAPRLITHRHRLQHVADLIADFCRSFRLLEEKSGLMLVQLPANLPYDPQRLQTALHCFDDPSRVVVEFRHPQWLTPEVFSLLENLGAGYCNPDSPEHQLSGLLSGRYGYLRLHGRRQWYADNYRQGELRSIAKTARQLQAQGAQEVFIFFNNDFEGYAPANAAALLQLLR